MAPREEATSASVARLGTSGWSSSRVLMASAGRSLAVDTRLARKRSTGSPSSRDEVRRGTYVEPSKLTLNRFLEEEWFPSIRASVRPTTWQHYRSMFDTHIRHSLGRTLLPNVTPARLNAFYAELLEHGRRRSSTRASRRRRCAMRTPCCTRHCTTPFVGVTSLGIRPRSRRHRGRARRR